MIRGNQLIGLDVRTAELATQFDPVIDASFVQLAEVGRLEVVFGGHCDAKC